MPRSIYCTVQPSQAGILVQELGSEGFPNDSVSVLMPDEKSSLDVVAKGVTTGQSTGVLLGGALGWMASFTALGIPGLGPFIAAGPILAALSGAVVGGAAGGLVGGLLGIGIPEVEAKQYEERIKNGSALISVHTNDDTETTHVWKIFERNGAADITSSAEAAV